MMNSGSRPQKAGWLATFQAALAPLPPAEDDGAPLPTPKGLIGATVASIIGGLLFLYAGLGSLLTANQQIASIRTVYQQKVTECKAVGGIGSVTKNPPAKLADLAKECGGYRVIKDADWASLRTQIVVISVVFLLMALAAIAAGWFLRSGAMWARRTIIAVVVIAVIGTLLLRISSTLTLVATVLLLVAVVLCYLGRGGLYFTTMAHRRRAA